MSLHSTDTTTPYWNYKLRFLYTATIIYTVLDYLLTTLQFPVLFKILDVFLFPLAHRTPVQFPNSYYDYYDYYDYSPVSQFLL